jgi:hypothetical protein
MLTKKFFCPVNGWDCPYWKENGFCSMVDYGDDPVVECIEAAYFYRDNEDYFVWENENGNRYDTQELLEQGYHFINDKPVIPLSKEINRIKSEMADLGTEIMLGKTCNELVKDIIEKANRTNCRFSSQIDT